MNTHADMDFDLQRAILDEQVSRLINPRFERLETVLKAGLISSGTPVLLMDSDQTPLVFNTLHLVSYHMAQSTQIEMPWLVSFCVICNAGACFVPKLDGKIYHFKTGGIYNAMVFLMDEETGSYWDHITGRCIYGPLMGEQLPRLPYSLLHMSAQQALNRSPDALFALSSLNSQQFEDAKIDSDDFNPRTSTDLPPEIAVTLKADDARLPRLEMGLAVWTDDSSCFYPFTRINAANNTIFEQFNGRRLLIYIDPETSIPAAFYTQATSAQWRGNRLQLSTGEFIENGVHYNSAGVPVRPELPLQLFHRWFSYALTFPGGAIYK